MIDYTQRLFDYIEFVKDSSNQDFFGEYLYLTRAALGLVAEYHEYLEAEGEDKFDELSDVFFWYVSIHQALGLRLKFRFEGSDDGKEYNPCVKIVDLVEKLTRKYTIGNNTKTEEIKASIIVQLNQFSQIFEDEESVNKLAKHNWDKLKNREKV